MKKILVIEDDIMLNEALKYDLTAENYLIDTCFDAESAFTFLKTNHIDLIILDINLPGMSGFDFIKLLRKEWPSVPVMILSACDLDEDILKGYDLGADEYITKPFNSEIFHRKIKVLLKTNSSINMFDYEDDHIKINIKKCLIMIDEKETLMTPTEFKILKYLLENKNTIVTRDNIISSLWDVNNKYIDEHTLTVNMNRLRKKIENQNHKYIKTVYGLGYIWAGKGYEK